MTTPSTAVADQGDRPSIKGMALRRHQIGTPCLLTTGAERQRDAIEEEGGILRHIPRNRG